MNPRYTLAAVITACILTILSPAQDKEASPKVSTDPLSADQLAVYQTVLKDYSKGSDEPLNIAETTYPFDYADGDGCVKWGMEKAKNGTQIIHKLTQLAALNPKLKMVDSAQQQETVDVNDPQKLIKGVINEGKQVTEKQLDDSLRLAFQTALFSFSEIAFDKQHRHAVLSYSFVCGSLCGHGNTLVLVKSGKIWKITKQCGGGWISWVGFKTLASLLCDSMRVYARFSLLRP